MVCNFNVNYKIQTNRSFQRLVLLYVSSHKRDNFDEKRVHELLFWNFTCRGTKSDCNVLQGLRIKGTRIAQRQVVREILENLSAFITEFVKNLILKSNYFSAWIKELY